MKVFSVHYRSISAECLHCQEVPTVIRVTSTVDGKMFVAVLCELHAIGEARASTGDMIQVGESDFYVRPYTKS